MYNGLYIRLNRCLIRYLLVVILLLFYSCTTTKYVPVEKEVVKTEYRNILQRDTTHIHDSIYVKVDGETQYIERWHTEYRDRLQRDTIIRNDSIRVPVPYEVEKKLSSWQQIKVNLGGYALVIIAALIAWLVYKKRNK